MNLAPLTSLRTIRIHLPLCFATGNAGESWAILLLLLDKVKTTPLTEVVVHLYFSVPKILAYEEKDAKGHMISHHKVIMPDTWGSKLDWKKLLIMLKRFRSLNTIRFYIALRIDFVDTFYEKLEEGAFKEIKAVIEENLGEFGEKRGLEVSWQQDNWPGLTI